MKKILLLVLLAIAFTLTGCKKTIPVHDYNNQQIPQLSYDKPSSENVEKAILRAAISLGWKTEKISNSEIIATLEIRTHRLVVSITHSDTEYSIKYKDSTNLLYDGKKIHRQYANWTKNLINAINAYSIPK